MTRNEQVHEALDEANRVRTAKAELKRDLRGRAQADGLAHLASLIVALDPIVLRCTVREALLACDHVGVSSLGGYVRHIGAVTADRRLSDLSPRQRGVLVAALRNPRAVKTYGRGRERAA
jgi:hypothetical protein